jgi:hypothetical protein
MNQALYAHMNKKKKKRSLGYKGSLAKFPLLTATAELGANMPDLMWEMGQASLHKCQAATSQRRKL